MIATYGIYLLICSVTLACIVWGFRYSRQGPESASGIPGFRTRIGYSNLDGMQSISLLLENESASDIQVDEIEIALRDLVASDQTDEAPCRGVLRIRQVVGPSDTLPISLAGVIYKAAGEPQREYSCGLSSVLRFRIDENTLEEKLEDYRIQMIGLTTSRIRRERKRMQRVAVPPPGTPQPSVAAIAAKFK